MKTSVVSLRLPSTVVADLEAIASYNRVSVGVALDWFLGTSLANSEALRGLQDCQDHCNRKLDARIPITTLEPLRAATTNLGISIAVYIRKLLYHSFVTKKLRYVQSQGDYTLANRHD
ncbi:MAG TPA: hypothetical protein VNY29_15600 [Terriglobales bacterium]|nr:hypothetical protein [Terriglobales bacterium]